MKKIRILMLGPTRASKGGVTSVVNQYYDAGLPEKVRLDYIATVNSGNRMQKLCIVIIAFIKYLVHISKTDVVHVHMSHRNSYQRKRIFIILASWFRKPILIHLHGSQFDMFYHDECSEKLQRKIRETFSLAKKVIVLSNEWKQKARSFISEEKIIVLHNAIIIPPFKRIKYVDKNVLFMGDIGKRKGIYDILKIIPEILKEHPTASFIFCGGGQIERCKSICLEKGILKNVHFKGWVKNKDKTKQFMQSSLFVLPSYNEGMPMAILEAMSYGQAVISTTVGGIPTVIQHGENGRLIEPGDTTALCENICDLLNDDKLKSQLGKKAFRTVDEHYNLRKNIGKLVEIYETMIID